MKMLLSLVAMTFLAACGVETATTAATSAEIKKREMEQAKKTQNQAIQKTEQAAQQIQQRVQSDAEKSKD